MAFCAIWWSCLLRVELQVVRKKIPTTVDLESILVATVDDTVVCILLCFRAVFGQFSEESLTERASACSLAPSQLHVRLYRSFRSASCPASSRARFNLGVTYSLIAKR